MTLPDRIPSPPADPFGLWQPAAVQEGAIAFGGLSGDEAEPRPAAVWKLELGDHLGEEELQQRAKQLFAIRYGLDAALPRVEALLARRAAGGVSFAAGDGAELLLAPEQSLARVLEGLEAQSQAEASFGLGEDLARLAGRLVGGADWNSLRQRLEEMVESVNRQLLHFVWIDTTLDGQLISRTIVNWGGDMRTLWQDGLPSHQIIAHQQSLAQALESRQANLHTILIVSQIAAKIALAVTTPLGPIQALSLGWQFVHDVILPLLESANKTPGALAGKE